MYKTISEPACPALRCRCWLSSRLLRVSQLLLTTMKRVQLTNFLIVAMYEHYCDIIWSWFVIGVDCGSKTTINLVNTTPRQSNKNNHPRANVLAFEQQEIPCSVVFETTLKQNGELWSDIWLRQMDGPVEFGTVNCMLSRDTLEVHP